MSSTCAVEVYFLGDMRPATIGFATIADIDAALAKLKAAKRDEVVELTPNRCVCMWSVTGWRSYIPSRSW